MVGPLPIGDGSEDTGTESQDGDDSERDPQRHRATAVRQ